MLLLVVACGGGGGERGGRGTEALKVEFEFELEGGIGSDAAESTIGACAHVDKYWDIVRKSERLGVEGREEADHCDDAETPPFMTFMIRFLIFSWLGLRTQPVPR